MKLKTLLILFLSILFLGTISAQETTLKGKIIDENNVPVPGVNVSVKGSQSGAISDLDGVFSIQVNEGQTLLFSFIGFEKQEFIVRNFNDINVTLIEELSQLDEIVVVGYGEMSKRDLTGAVTQIKEEDNIKTQYQSVDQLLQGRSSGIQVTGNDGVQGGAMSVRIRGTNSLRGNNEPLYVIDGIIISTAGEGVADANEGSNYITPAQNGLTGLNPRDIESIEVLKDASATAIYGSRGANGVVLITTKKGTKGEDKINVYANTTISQNSKQIDVLNGQDYAKFINEFNVTQGNEPLYNIDGTTGAITDVETGSLFNVHNWQDEIYQQAVSYNAGLSLSGGSDKTSYYISANYLETNGTMPVSGSQGGNIRLNLNRKFSEKLTIDAKGTVYYNKGSYAQTGARMAGNTSLVNQTVMKSPLLGEDDIAGDNSDSSNPLSIMRNNDDLTEEFRTNLSGSATYKFTKFLSYQLRVGADIRSKQRDIWYGPGTFRGDQLQGSLSSSNLNRKAFTIDNLLTFNKTFGADHKINAVAGVTYDAVFQSNSIYSVRDFSVFDLRTERPDLAATIDIPNTKYRNDYSFNSFLARANYSFKNKYIITASVRQDGSSKFQGENKWGIFPAVSGAWYVSDEAFLKTQEVVSNLKFRAGWGRTGNSSIQPYQTILNYGIERYADANGGAQIGFYPAYLANPNLTWETTEQTNIGIDLGFLNDRINITADVYSKETQDLLQRIQVPRSTGFPDYLVNQGTIYNKGVELSLDVVALDKSNFSLSFNGNINFNRTEVGDLGVAPSTFNLHGEEVERQMIYGNTITTGNFLRQSPNMFIQGEEMGLFQGYKTNGIYKDQTAADAGPTFQGQPNQPGDIAYVDVNGDGNIDTGDLTTIGNPNPDFTYAFGFNMRYKNVSLNALFNGVQGNQIINSGSAFYGYATPQNGVNNVTQEAYNNAWSESNPDASSPRIGYGADNGANAYLNDRIVEDGSYLRLSTITLSYDLPVEKLGMTKVDNINFYVTGRNLLTFTNYSGYDPEISSYMYDGTILGVDWQTYPNLRSFIFGFNMTF